MICIKQLKVSISLSLPAAHFIPQNQVHSNLTFLSRWPCRCRYISTRTVAINTGRHKAPAPSRLRFSDTGLSILGAILEEKNAAAFSSLFLFFFFN
ncbi:hypothetical protein AAHA92_31517 [Salvia divinorum]|uniref:Uncharacterized protein n=1 Tax=Salvia divinorum TaxID=28513 RepID=A0ABD1FR25_SALDI